MNFPNIFQIIVILLLLQDLFILSLLFNVRRGKYLALYETYKKAKLQQSTTNGKIYEININDEYAKELNDFINVNR